MARLATSRRPTSVTAMLRSASCRDPARRERRDDAVREHDARFDHVVPARSPPTRRSPPPIRPARPPASAPGRCRGSSGRGPRRRRAPRPDHGVRRTHSIRRGATTRSRSARKAGRVALDVTDLERVPAAPRGATRSVAAGYPPRSASRRTRESPASMSSAATACCAEVGDRDRRRLDPADQRAVVVERRRRVHLGGAAGARSDRCRPPPPAARPRMRRVVPARGASRNSRDRRRRS